MIYSIMKEYAFKPARAIFRFGSTYATGYIVGSEDSVFKLVLNDEKYRHLIGQRIRFRDIWIECYARDENCFAAN